MRGNGTFWRALNAARRANLAEAGQAMPVAGPSGMSRRRLLGAMAASASVPLVGCQTVASAPPRPGMRVAIVGGGIAGLVALRDLRAAGVDARLYEARERLGGRVLTHMNGPVPADDGGQFINSDHTDVRALCRRFGLRLIDRKPMPGRTIVVSDGRTIGEEELARALQPLAEAIATDSAALDEDWDASAQVLDALSVAQYLDRHAHAIPHPWIRDLMESTVRTEFGQDASEASALELVFNLPVADGRHIEMIGSSDERYVIAGGSGTLTQALAGDLSQWCALGQVLESISPVADGPLSLRFAGGRTVEADRVIVTVPAPLMRTIDYGNLLSQEWREYIAEIDCGRNEKLNATYRGRPWTASAQTMGRSGDVWPLRSGFAEMWDAGTTVTDTGLLTYFMGGSQCAAGMAKDLPALRREFEATATPAIPGLSAADNGWQRRTMWGNDRFSRGAYSCFKPGQLTRFGKLFWVEEKGKATQSAIAGPIVFAGEHLSDAFPGYIEGGAQTGRLAARAVLRGDGIDTMASLDQSPAPWRAPLS